MAAAIACSARPADHENGRILPETDSVGDVQLPGLGRPDRLDQTGPVLERDREWLDDARPARQLEGELPSRQQTRRQDQPEHENAPDPHGRSIASDAPQARHKVAHSARIA